MVFFLRLDEFLFTLILFTHQFAQIDYAKFMTKLILHLIIRAKLYEL